MAIVIGVRFKNAGKLFYFDPGTLLPFAGESVIVETSRGLEFGKVITSLHEVSDEAIGGELKPVIRIATYEDFEHQKQNEIYEKQAYKICQQKIEAHKLDMKLVGVEQTFDNSKILFYFTSNGRVDFRMLVKDLAAVFHMRIELRQIGVRDEAKMLGGLGPCGRPICCGTFQGDFQPVSIKMAKEQNLSLNPTKISGVCGRLMCCLKFEQDHYESTRKRMPKYGREVITPDGTGSVTEINILKETVSVSIDNGESREIKTFPLEDIKYPKHNAPKHAPQPSAKNKASEETRSEDKNAQAESETI